MRRATAMLLAIGGLAGCASQAEIAEALATERQSACETAGFASGTDEFKLCLLIQETNQRLTALNRRIGFLENDVTRFGFYGYGLPYCGGCD